MNRIVVGLVCAVIAGGLSSASAAETGVVIGTVTAVTGEPVTDADIRLADVRRRARTDPQGGFRLERVPVGRHWVEIVSARYGSAVVEVQVGAGEEARLDVRLDLTVHREALVVSVAPSPQSTSGTAQSVAVLEGADLGERLAPTLGETLAREPGVTSTSYAPGASRPVIRGLGGDRIRILEGGVGVGDASSFSPDHAVSFDPINAERVEVVRGAATLLYGGTGIGGIVNIIDGRIPDHVPSRAIVGQLDLRAGSVADERTGALKLEGGGGSLAWQASGFRRSTDDVDSGAGRIFNSDIESDGGSIGGSWIGESARIGAAYSAMNTEYGAAVEDEVRIDLEQRRIDLFGEIERRLGIFDRLRVRFGSADYEHAELEDDEVGTRFLSDSWEGRVELAQRAMGRVRGTVGLQFGHRDLEAIGDEAFVLPTATRQMALFALEEIELDTVRVELGARVDRQRTESADPALRDRSISGVSASAGVVWQPSAPWAFAVSLSRSSRLPTAEELYSDGPHIATFAYEVGDDSLGRETGLGIDLAVRRRTGRVTGELSLFAQRFNDFIYDEDTGDTFDLDGDELPIFAFVQSDALFEGAEAHVDIELWHTEPHHIDLEIRGDVVRAELRADDEPLPRIPPSRIGLGLRYRGAKFWGHVEGMRVASQSRVAPIETRTEGHTLVSAAAGYRWFAASTVHEIILRGTNLSDRLALNHVSRFKEEVPLPGRDINLSYRLIF